MANHTIQLNDDLHAYLLGISLREPEILAELRQETAKLDMSIMQIAPEQGQFMSMLMKLTGARRAIEIGVFTGYSTLCMALPMPADGKIIACDINREWTDIAQHYWQKAGQAGKIELHLGPAMQTLASMLENEQANSFEFAFIDADKPNYCNYYEACLQLVRPGGLIAIDNVLWGGSVIDEDDDSEDTVAIRELNELLHDDDRVDITMVPIGDGLTLARLK
jgi:predicted O-methyltransferase YrrM